LLLSLLPHSNEDPNDQKDEYKRSYTQTTKEDDLLSISTAIFLVVSLLLVSSFFESRNEIPFKGVDFSHPEISQFQDVNRKIIKQEFSHDFKIFLNIYFVYMKSSIGKVIV
jgi:hypothetical protein